VIQSTLMQNQKSEIGNRKSDWSVLGHGWAVTLLQHAVETRHQAHAYLFTGLANIGRRTLALALARTLNCVGEQPPCDLSKEGICRSCRLIASGNHPDVRVLSPDGASIKIGQVRELQHDLALSPVVEASNALLKTLEEPPSYVVLVLIATEPDLLLPTIVSRCQHLPLRPLTVEQVSQALESGWSIGAERAIKLAHFSGGRLGWAVTAAQDETVLEKRAERLDDLAKLLGANGKRVARFAYAEELASGNAAVMETLELWETWWRDVMLLAAGSTAPLVNVDRLPTLQQHAARFGADRARLAIAAISRTAHQITRNANARLALEVLMLDLPAEL
jgi:DNA polymerase III subunit delta'